MSKSTVTSKGQVTIPKDIRVKAMIHEGTHVDFQFLSDGNILLIPIQRHVSQLKGIVKFKAKKSVSLAEMKNAIAEGANEAMK